MNNSFRNLFVILVVLALQSCSAGRYDKEGRLYIEDLTSVSGERKLAPMIRSDSASVMAYVPDTFLLKNNPYTGGVVQYEKDTMLFITGFLKNGVMDSAWRFYYKTGGLRMEGNYKDGYENGLWRSYYGYNKVKIEKFYDEHGFMLMRREFYDNGSIMNYQNVKSPLYGDQERMIRFDRRGQVDSLYGEPELRDMNHEQIRAWASTNGFRVAQ